MNSAAGGGLSDGGRSVTTRRERSDEIGARTLLRNTEVIISGAWTGKDAQQSITLSVRNLNKNKRRKLGGTNSHKRKT